MGRLRLQLPNPGLLSGNCAPSVLPLRASYTRRPPQKWDQVGRGSAARKPLPGPTSRVRAAPCAQSNQDLSRGPHTRVRLGWAGLHTGLGGSPGTWGSRGQGPCPTLVVLPEQGASQRKKCPLSAMGTTTTHTPDTTEWEGRQGIFFGKLRTEQCTTMPSFV